MLTALVPISALLIAAAFLLLGHGLSLTLLPISASALGFSDAQVAFTGSANFLGFVFGCLATPHILNRVGHIRSFAVLATSYSIVVLIFPWLDMFLGWMLLRFIVGVTISGLYMIIESWLNESCDSSNRGSVLSIYIVLNLIMMVCGQQLLNLGNVDSHMLFGLAAISISIAIIPVSLTLSSEPARVGAISFKLKKVWERSHIGLSSAVASGLVTGAYWSLAPIYAKAYDFDKAQLTAYMSAVVLGGACFQWPLGRLSDMYDRRVILIFLALAGILLSVLLVALPLLTPQFGGWPASSVAFFWGAACMTIYAIGLAHATDSTPPDEFLSTGQAMLIVFGVCSAVGAPIAAFTMDLLGAAGLYVFSGLCMLIFLIMIIIRRHQHVLTLTEEDKESFRVTAELTSPVVYEIDPRGDNE